MGIRTHIKIAQIQTTQVETVKNHGDDRAENGVESTSYEKW